MGILVVGDVHGCLSKFKEIVENHWDKDNEILVQVGDIIDRGSDTPGTVRYCIKHTRLYKDRFIILKGNHEDEMLRHFRYGVNYNWLSQSGYNTIRQYEKRGINVEPDLKWMEQLVPYWENESVFISHAGISEQAQNPFNLNDNHGILWNRSGFKNIGKLQIVGHTPNKEGKPVYDSVGNTWNIDTGAVFNGGLLTAMRLTDAGQVIELIQI